MDKLAERLIREKQFWVRVPNGAIFTRYIGDASVVLKMWVFRIWTRVCPLRVRRFVHWAIPGRPIDFMLCSVFMSSWNRITDSAFAFTTLLPSVERQCPHCLLETTFLFSRIGSYSSDSIVILTMFAPFQFRTCVCPLRVRRFVHWATAARHIDFHSSLRIYVVLVAHSITLSLHYLLLYGGNVRIAALD